MFYKLIIQLLLALVAIVLLNGQSLPSVFASPVNNAANNAKWNCNQTHPTCPPNAYCAMKLFADDRCRCEMGYSFNLATDSCDPYTCVRDFQCGPNAFCNLTAVLDGGPYGKCQCFEYYYPNVDGNGCESAVELVKPVLIVLVLLYVVVPIVVLSLLLCCCIWLCCLCCRKR